MALVFSEYMSNLVWGQTLSIGMLRVIAACLIGTSSYLGEKWGKRWVEGGVKCGGNVGRGWVNGWVKGGL